MKFVESADGFSDLAFNALTGEEGHNPTINANVGDKIVFTVENAGKGFHAFGVTSAEEGFSGIFTGSEVAAAISEPQSELLKSSGVVTTPNAWNPFPAFVAVKVISSPEFTTKSGL